jgi:hypothetical protein
MKKSRGGIKHGIPMGSGKVSRGIAKGSGRVAHSIGNSAGNVSMHSGQVPKISNSVAKSHSQLDAARAKSHPSTHPVKIPGGPFSGKVNN